MNMFKTSDAKTAEEYIAAQPEDRQTILNKVHQTILKAIPEQKPVIMYGMIGYGTYPYKSKSGKQGEWSYVLLANQKQYVSLYICGVDNGTYIAEKNKDRLGKVSVGKSCVRFKKIEDIDLDMVSELAKQTVRLGGLANFYG